MELERTKEILQSLADGIDPYTGISFPPDSPYQRADTVRALHAALQSLGSSDKPTKPVDPNKPRAGGKWTPEEEDRLRTAHKAGTRIPQLARDHGRTPGAISSRLVKLGLLEDTPTNRTGQASAPPPGISRAPKPPPAKKQPDDDDMPF